MSALSISGQLYSFGSVPGQGDRVFVFGCTGRLSVEPLVCGWYFSFRFRVKLVRKIRPKKNPPETGFLSHRLNILRLVCDGVYSL